MAIGDAVADVTGTAAESRQPSSGVEEKITAFGKNNTSDAINIKTTAADQVSIFDTGVNLAAASAVATSGSSQPGVNMAYMITNATFLDKTGSTDKVAYFGVQTNA